MMGPNVKLKAGVWIEFGPKMKHLREYRACFDWEMKELAAFCHVSQPTVSNWEIGRCEPTERHKKALVKALGLASTTQIVYIS